MASNIGTWMQNTGAAWLMTELTDSATAVALVQTATYLPAFLLGFLAGALADVLDRRRILLIAQAGMAVTSATLGVLTFMRAIDPLLLLVLTLLIGLGTAFTLPAWQAIIPETVSGPTVSSAVTLNAASINLARATGPALGGFIIAAAEPGYVFVLNAISFVGLMIVLYRWRREVHEDEVPRERVISAVKAGGRYVRHAPALRSVLVRVALFTAFGSALWALLPIVARGPLELDSAGYGGLLGCLGLGAVMGAALLPRLRAVLAPDPLLVTASLVFAGLLAGLAFMRSVPVLAALLVVGGFAWISVLSSLTAATTTLAPAWVRARALAAYLLIFQGAMAGGGLLWGLLAERAGETATLFSAALGLAITVPAAARWRVERTQGLDLSPSGRPQLELSWDPELEQGPVLVVVDYRIRSEEAEAFTQAARRLGLIRRRDGARRWGVFRDARDPIRWLEVFEVESWAEYLRQRERLTKSDMSIQESVRDFHTGEEPPAVFRFIGEENIT